MTKLIDAFHDFVNTPKFGMNRHGLQHKDVCAWEECPACGFK